MLSSNKIKLIGIFQILIGASLFGLIPIFVRLGKDIDMLSLVFFRAFFASIAIFIILKLRNRRLSSLRKDLFKVIIWALILLFAIISYFFSLKRIDIASATLLLNLNSIFIIILSNILLKEKIYPLTILSLILSLFGTAFIVDFSNLLHDKNFIGYFAAISAAFWTGLNFVYPKYHFKAYDTYSMTFYQSIFQIPFLLPFIIINPPTLTTTKILIFLGLGLFCTAFAFTLIYSGSQKIKSQFVGIFQTSESIVPIILACFIFKEYPSFPKIIGGIILIIAYLIIILGDTNAQSSKCEHL
jgi:drug/metabolite transporter (DMT)-like permease